MDADIEEDEEHRGQDHQKVAVDDRRELVSIEDRLVVTDREVCRRGRRSVREGKGECVSGWGGKALLAAAAARKDAAAAHLYAEYKKPPFMLKYSWRAVSSVLSQPLSSSSVSYGAMRGLPKSIIERVAFVRFSFKADDERKKPRAF